MDIMREFQYDDGVLQVLAHGPDCVEARKVPLPTASRWGRPEIRGLDVRRDGHGWVITARVTGTNIAYIFVESFLKDPEAERYYGPVIREHVRAGQHRETRGIDHPVWSNPVEVVSRVSPRLRTLTDESGTAFCFSAPEGYGSSDRRVGGGYTPAGGNKPMRAHLVFTIEGELKRMLVYKERGLRSMPRSVIPRRGDRFAPRVQVLTPTDTAEGWLVSTALSTPLVVGEQGLRVATGALLPGEYVAGLAVQDLDGGLTREYVPVVMSEPETS